MKSILITMRIIFIGIFWSIFFLEGIRVILLTNWRFDIFLGRHWRHLQNLWMQGWVIDDPKEWAFVLIILTFIPLWLTGWAALSLIAWDQLIIKAALFPIRIFRRFFYKPVKIISNKKSGKTLKKKKSYKEIRPRSIRAPIDERMEEALPRPTTLSNQVIKNTPKQAAPAPTFPALSTPAPQETKSFDHSLFQFDDDNGDDFDFNFDAFDTPAEKPRESITPKPEPAKENSRQQSKDRNNRDRRDNNKRDNRKNQPAKPETQTTAPQHATGSTIDIIKQKGYEVITGATLHNNLIDFIGI
uniref:hypothetical protein n=1 Tax=Candidatus Scatocola faecipullorum TaxID=2840917 RepID=UPI004027DD58